MKHFVIIGLGSIGRRHATNLAAMHPNARFTIVRHQGNEDDFTRRLDARIVDDLSQVDDETVDLVVLATPSANHIDTLPSLIRRGWPLLVEKPIVTTVDDCELIGRELSSAEPAVRAAGFNLRHLPSIGKIRDHLVAGDLGQIVRASFIAGQWLPDWRPGTDYRASYSADADRGGGVELDLAHEFDLSRWFFGELNVDFASGGTFSNLELRSNDTAVSVLSPVQSSAPLVTVSLDYVSRQRIRWYEVVGDQGRMEWNIGGSLELMTAEGRRVISNDPADYDVGSTYVTMLKAVMADIECGETPRRVQSLVDGLLSTRLALEARDRGSLS